MTKEQETDEQRIAREDKEAIAAKGTRVNTNDGADERIAALVEKTGAATFETAEGAGENQVYILKNSDGAEILRGTLNELEEKTVQPGEEAPATEDDEQAE